MERTPAQTYDVRIDGGDTIIIANDNTTIGYATLDATMGEITYIFVHPHFRRQGFGYLLVKIATEHAGTPLTPAPPISPLGSKLFATLSKESAPPTERPEGPLFR